MGIPKETHLNCKFMHEAHFSYAARVKFQTTVYLMCNVFCIFTSLWALTGICIYLFIWNAQHLPIVRNGLGLDWCFYAVVATGQTSHSL